MIRLFRACCLLIALAWAAPAIAQEAHDHTSHSTEEPVKRTTAWPKEVVELAESLPIQEGGRVKPMHTFAGFAMLRMNGKRTLATPSGETLSPTEWLLDLIYFPEQANTYALFRVDDIAAIREIGAPTEGKQKRDRWSFAELEPHIQKLSERASAYHAIDEKQRDSVQGQVVLLADSVHEYLSLINNWDSLAFFPPARDAKTQPTWLSPGEIVMSTSRGETISTEHAALLEDLKSTLRERENMGEFHKAFAAFTGRAKELARARGEYEKVGLELSYYKAKLLDNAQVIFILGFVLVAFVWLRPRAKWLYRATAATAVVSTGFLVAAIVMRCMIRGRPPVSTLYETLLFVTAVSSIVALCMEWINRRKLALSASLVLGMLGLFVANRFEELDKRDTMPQLQAVLDTNFWLATHVTAITVGYSAGMLAALLANAYLISRLFGIRKSDPTHLKSVIRMTYGVLAFGLIFSVVGTILGGIWANDSWGRFWGWDPKENGALLICLTQIVILHLRMGGYIRDFGIAMATAFGGTVVAFSWFGVNLLGVGLHSYGFTAGINFALWSYYIGQWGLLAICGVHYLIQRSRQEALRTAEAGERPTPAARGVLEGRAG